MPNIGNALISAAGGVAGGLINGVSSLIGAKQQYKYDIQRMNKQDELNRAAEARSLQYQKDIIDYTNDYNSPINQRQRYEEAGYNPFLVDTDSGQMTQPTAVGASAPEAAGRNSARLDVGSFVTNAINGALQQQLETKKLALENKKLDNSIRLEDEKISFDKSKWSEAFEHQKDMDNKSLVYRDAELALKREYQDHNISQDQLNYGLKLLDQQLRQQDFLLKQERQPYEISKLKADIRNISARTGLTEAQIVGTNFENQIKAGTFESEISAQRTINMLSTFDDVQIRLIKDAKLALSQYQYAKNNNDAKLEREASSRIDEFCGHMIGLRKMEVSSGSMAKYLRVNSSGQNSDMDYLNLLLGALKRFK